VLGSVGMGCALAALSGVRSASPTRVHQLLGPLGRRGTVVDYSVCLMEPPAGRGKLRCIRCLPAERGALCIPVNPGGVRQGAQV
jgi:hypothetical protein